MACENRIECIQTSFKCDDGLPKSGNYAFLNDVCQIDPPYKSKTLFDFGIFLEALQSGVVQSKHFSEKFFHCFWWGLRNLRFARIDSAIPYYLAFQNNFYNNIYVYIAILFVSSDETFFFFRNCSYFLRDFHFVFNSSLKSQFILLFSLFLLLFMHPFKLFGTIDGYTVLFQLIFTFIYSTFSKINGSQTDP